MMRFAIVVVSWHGLVTAALLAGERPSDSYQRAVLQDRPVGYWRFEEPPAAKIAENRGSLETALAGSYVDVSILSRSASPALGQALAFGRPTSAVVVATPLDRWLNGTATLEFWINTTQSGSGSWNAPSVAGADSNGDGKDLFWGINNDGRIGVRRGDSGPAALSAIPLNDGIWHHVVITRDAANGTMRVYADGRTSPAAVFDDADDLQITTSYRSLGVVEHLPGGAQKMKACLDEVAIYDYVLSAEQVMDHYHAAGTTNRHRRGPRLLELERRVDLLTTEVRQLRAKVQRLTASDQR